MIEKEIIKPRSAQQANKIVQLVLENPDNLEELMIYFLSKNHRLCQSASWSVGILASKAPHLLTPFLPTLIQAHKNPPHDSVLRNSIRAWQFMDIPEEYEGEIFDLCFKYISNPLFPVAIRAFSMTVCFNIAKQFPALLEELKAKLELLDHSESPGIRSRFRKILKAIDKIL